MSDCSSVPFQLGRAPENKIVVNDSAVSRKHAEIVAQNSELAPLALIETNAALHSLVAQSLASRPELKQSELLIAAARDTKSGTTYGPLIPTLGASEPMMRNRVSNLSDPITLPVLRSR